MAGPIYITVDAAPAYAMFSFLRENYPRILRNELLKSANRIVIPKIQETLAKDKINYKGKLSKSLIARAKGEPPNIEIVADTPYAAYVELGSEPRAVPGNEKKRIKTWVKNKLKVKPESVDNVAKRVIKGIQESGNQDHPYFFNSFEMVRVQFLDTAITAANRQAQSKSAYARHLRRFTGRIGY